MAITMSIETQQLFESRMKELGFASCDEFLQSMLRNYEPSEVLDYDDLDEETRQAIEEGQREVDQGLGRPWAEVDAELRARFVKPKP